MINFKKGTNSIMKKLKCFFKNILNYVKKHKFIVIASFITLILFIISFIKLGWAPAIVILMLMGSIIAIFSRPRKKKKTKTRFQDVLKTILIIGLIMFIIGLMGIIAFLGYIVKTAPEFNVEKLYNKEPSFLYTIDGEEFAKLGSEFRQQISYSEMSESLIDAIIATEDSRYFQHSGVDLPRFIKASISQLLGKGGGGASTITMQVSKNKFTSNKDEGIAGIIRKFSDIYISVFKIETHFTKEQIIEFYANYNYLGGGAHGVEQASLNYFGKHAKDLNVAESAMIAGLFQAPVAYDPLINPEKCEDRRQTILYLMLRHGYINEEEYNIAKELTVDKLLVSEKNNNNATEYQDFINVVVQEVIDRTGYNPYNTPMKIYTTMNKSMQNTVNGVMQGKTYTWENDDAQAGITVLDVKTGAILAVGGSRDTIARGDNYAVNLKNQIGSTAKPLYDYGPALEYKGYNTYSPIADEHIKYTGTNINVKNWDSKYEYLLTMQDALKGSRNTPALRVFQSLNKSDIAKFVNGLHLSPEEDLHEAHAIGGYNGESPLSLAAAYAAFSNGGFYIEPHSYTAIEFTEADEVVEPKFPPQRVMSTETAYMMTKMLEAIAPSVSGNVNGVNYASKSGTTNFTAEQIKALKVPEDAVPSKWLSTFNDSYAISVWYGYKSNSTYKYMPTSSPKYRDIFKAVAKDIYTKKSTWNKPDSIVEVVMENIAITNGKSNANPNIVLASNNTPNELKVTAYFRKGFEPTEVSKRFNQLSKVSNINYDVATDTLSWDGVELNSYFQEEYLRSIFDSYFNNKEDLEKQIAVVMDYNTKSIGNIIYDIYTKDDEGNLTKIASTSDTSYEYPIDESTTFVIKTNYSVLKTCESDEAEFTMTIEADVITSSLNGQSTVTVDLDGDFDDLSKPVTVLRNGTEDITDDCDITISVLRKSDNSTFNGLQAIETLTEDTYVISYNITYRDYHETIKRTINIVDPNN